MDDWEYKLLDSKEVTGSFVFGKSHRNVEEYLNHLGSAGWEVVGLDFMEDQERLSFVGVAKRRRVEQGPNATPPAPAGGHTP